MRIGVVIPYYQREAGILRRALASIAAQELPDGVSVEVVVVDDGSPAPIAPEIETVALPGMTTVTVVAQPNGGPGAARNRGLDHLARTHHDIVAFLDSDDSWKPQHLAEAVAALALGYDLYFCQNVRTGSEQADLDGGSRELARLRQPGEPGVTWLGADGDGPSLIGVESNRLLAGYLEAYLSQTSTVVMTADLARANRFDARLRSAGEDLMLWIDLALSGARAVISAALNVECGQGVNIYFSAFDFDSPKAVERVGSVLLFWLFTETKLRSRGRAGAPPDQIKRYRRGYSYLFIRSLARGQTPSFTLLRRIVREDPFLLPAMPFRFLSVLPHRAQEAPTW